MFSDEGGRGTAEMQTHLLSRWSLILNLTLKSRRVLS